MAQQVAIPNDETALAHGIRNYWYPVFRSADLGRGPVGIKRLGEDLVLWRDADGCPRVFHDTCAHRGARLLVVRLPS